MADRDYRFPPLGGWGNPANPWHFDYGEPAIQLVGHRGTAMLMMVTTKTLTTATAFGPQGPIGTMEDRNGSFDNWWRTAGATITFYPAATIARSSAPNDVPANTWVPDLMEPTLNFGRSLFTGVEPTNITAPAAGIIDLTDPGGDLEYMLNYLWDGAKVVIKRGRSNQPFSTWAEVGVFTGAACIASMDKKTVRLRDLGWKLSASLHDETYTGDGGIGGDVALKGIKKPYCAGYCFNVDPVPINGQSQIFQWSFTPSAAVMELRHGGVPIQFYADYPSFDALVSAPIPSAYYGTCLAQSLVRLNLTLNFGIRVDVLGDNSVQYGHPAPVTRAAVARRIATSYSADHSLSDYEEIDSEAFDKVETDHPAFVGYYWQEAVSKAEALNEVMMGICGWWHIRPNGKLAIGYARNPTSGLSVQSLPYMSDGMGLIEIVDTAVPRWKTRIGWRRNYGPQSRDQLAGSVSQTNATIFAGETRYAESVNATVNDLYPTAREVTINGGFWLLAEAQIEADRQQIMMEKERRRFRWEMEIDPFADLINQVLTITGVNRMGLGASTPLLCVAMDNPGVGPTTTEWWG